MNDFFKPPKTKTLLWILTGLLGILIVFGLGITVGYRRAIFSSDFGATYYHEMYGTPFGKPTVMVMSNGPMAMHGVAGQVIDVDSSTILVQDPNGAEEAVFVASGTTIREMNQDIAPSGIVVGDGVTVIGEPDTNGQVEARFIRVFEVNSSTNF